MTLADADTAAGQQVALSEGENVIKMKVTAQDGTSMETYTVTVTRAAVSPPAAPTGLSATADNSRVALAWTKPASDAVITHHEYRYKTDSDYQDNWETIPHSAPGGFNEDGFTVTGLDNGTAHTFPAPCGEFRRRERFGGVERGNPVRPRAHRRVHHDEALRTVRTANPTASVTRSSSSSSSATTPLARPTRVTRTSASILAIPGKTPTNTQEVAVNRPGSAIRYKKAMSTTTASRFPPARPPSPIATLPTVLATTRSTSPASRRRAPSRTARSTASIRRSTARW